MTELVDSILKAYGREFDAETRATLNSVFAEHQVVSASQCGLTGKRAATRFCGENPEGRSS